MHSDYYEKLRDVVMVYQGTAQHLSGWNDRKNKIAFTAVCIDQDYNRVPSQYKPKTVLLEPTCLICSYDLRLNIYTLNIAQLSTMKVAVTILFSRFWELGKQEAGRGGAG